MNLEILRSLQEAAREAAEQEIALREVRYERTLLTITEIDKQAIAQSETWLTRYDFGWERVLKWKRRPAHSVALDAAIWYGGTLAGLCWATPKESHEKVFVLYLERNPDNELPTRGYIAPLGLSASRNYAMLLNMRYVVINDPNPGARNAYHEEGFQHIPGVGLAYDLTQDYDAGNHEVHDDDC